MARQSKKSAPATVTTLDTMADHIAATMVARMATSAALATAMEASARSSSAFKNAVFSEILTLREAYVGQIPTGNSAIREVMHASYVRDVRELFGFGNAKQAGQVAADGSALYSTGLVYAAVLAKCADATKTASACENFSRIRKIALAVWTEPGILTNGQGENRALNDVAADATKYLKTGTMPTASTGTGAKAGTGTGAKAGTPREAFEALVATTSAAQVLSWLAELLAVDAKYRAAHSTELAALTALAKQL